MHRRSVYMNKTKFPEIKGNSKVSPPFVKVEAVTLFVRAADFYGNTSGEEFIRKVY